MLSIIVPTYNSITRMRDTIDSLTEIPASIPHEVIFIDDQSTDGTADELRSLTKRAENWRFAQLSHNSGSGAAPRNAGIDMSEGTYLFFLDADDVLIPSGLANAYDFAVKHDADAVRSALLVVDSERESRVSDRVPRWDTIRDPDSRLRAIVKYQSLTCSFLMKRSIVTENNIRFLETRRIGEDITFTAQVLVEAKRIAYRDAPVRKYVKHASGESVTQKIRDRDFGDFIASWVDVQDILASRGISFMHEHGHAAMLYALRQYLWFRDGHLSPETFAAFSSFCNVHWNDISHFPLPPRYREIVVAVRDGEYEEFLSLTRLRLLIAGHDLKFIRGLDRHLREHYEVKYDKWDGHVSHNEETSRELLAWADYVWVEWLLGAAVWYSSNLRRDQRLIVRTHRSEVTADYGLQVEHNNVSKYVAIAPHTLGDFSDRFDIPRSRFALIPNFFDVDNYRSGDHPDRIYHLGMVGIVPKLKGYHRAIDILDRLRQIDDRYVLHVYGRRPEEYTWVMASESARRYYEACESDIRSRGLTDSVVFEGWVDTKTALSNVGFVLSLSDYEGMQVAPGEGYCAGAIGIFRRWRGVEACYPAEFIFDSDEQIANYIASFRDREDHAARAEAGKEFIRANYSVNRVLSEILELMDAVRA